MKRPFEQNLILGAVAERAAAVLFGRHGFHLENNADAHARDGRGPSLTLATGAKLPRPDYTFSDRGVSIAVEIKAKCGRSTGEITKEVETGIDYRKWIDYQDYARVTGIPVFMLFLEYMKDLAAKILRDPEILLQWKQEERIRRFVFPDAVYGAWLADLQPSLGGRPTPCYGTDMVYFSLQQFKWSVWDCVDLLNAHVGQHAKALI